MSAEERIEGRRYLDECPVGRAIQVELHPERYPIEGTMPWIPSDEELQAFRDDLFNDPEFMTDFDEILAASYRELFVTGELTW